MSYEVKQNIDVSNYCDELEKYKVGQVFTFDDAERMAKKKRYFKTSLSQAIKRLRGFGIIFYNIRGIGYKRASSSDIVKTSPTYVKKANKTLRRCVNELEQAQDSELTKEEIVKKNTMYAVSGMMLHLSKKKQVNKIEQKAMNGTMVYDPAEALKYLTKF